MGGRSHYGKGQSHGYYGYATPGSAVSKGFEDSYGYHKGGSEEAKVDGSGEPVRKWWTKLEKDQHNGMSARKEYDAVGADLLASGRYDMQAVARILLEKEKAKQAQAAAGRLSDEDKTFAREIAKAVASHTEDAVPEKELDEEDILKAKKKAQEEERKRKEEHEMIVEKERKAEKEANEQVQKNEEQEEKEVETQLKEEQRDQEKKKK